MNRSLTPEQAKSSITAVRWFVWSDENAAVADIRPATEDEITTQTVPEGHFLVSDPMTLIIHEGSDIFNGRTGLQIDGTINPNGGIVIFQQNGAMAGNPGIVSVNNANDLDALIEALQQVRDFIYKS